MQINYYEGKDSLTAEEQKQLDLLKYGVELNELYIDKEQNNAPLSWEELKKLKGKPVWVEEKYSFLDEWYGQWEVIDDFFWEEPYFYGVPYVSMTDKENRRKDDLGKKWNAYRKERS